MNQTARTTRSAAVAAIGWAVLFGMVASVRSAHADERYHSDSDARYLHHISLYDIDNRKITPESTRPYSPVNTCVRCHDYETIAHGWHFNAFEPDSVDGRRGEPWIWTDPKTGTQLPLSYRDWSHTYDPKEIGLSAWEMTHQFGARIPGGNMGANADQQEQPQTEPSVESGEGVEAVQDQAEQDQAEQTTAQRWQFSGALDIDCMICHAVSGAYDIGERRLHIGEENFAWAPTAAIRLGKVEGRVSTIKNGSDPEDEATQKKIPQVSYDASRFNPDGTVFMDLIRKPAVNACYQCHSNRTATSDGIEPRWSHDQDVHLRAGMDCVDCHRNGIDHHIVRGFDGEENPSGQAVETLSCQGCHLGTIDDSQDLTSTDIDARAGRLGSPQPMHAGLPPIHFEKLSCTACHGGPAPRQEALRIMTSLAHGLGEKGHRTGQELPAILGPVYSPGEDGRVYPHRAMWPAFWGKLDGGRVEPIAPPQAYDLTRRALRVRSDFVEELLKPKMSSSDLKELLGDERAGMDEEWSEQEQAKVDTAQAAKGREQFSEKVYAALLAIEEELKIEQAVYVSSGKIYARGEEEDSLKTIEVADEKATKMIQWPMAHNVRPAGWSLGAAGCTECHSDDGMIFTSTIRSVGPGPDQGEPINMASLQGVDPDQRLQWNELFQGRKSFKYIVAGSIAILLMTLCVGIGAMAARLAGKASAS